MCIRDSWYFATNHAPFEPSFFPPFPEPATGSWLHIVESGPDNSRQAIARLYFAAIAGAQRRIALATPYFVPNEALTAALITAALRGVEVRILTPKHSDSRLVTAAALSYYDELTSAGVHIYQYGPAMLHAKLLSIDDRIAVAVSYTHLDVYKRQRQINGVAQGEFEQIRRIIGGNGDVDDLRFPRRTGIARRDVNRADSTGRCV